jgi:hypothetical protein
MEDEMSSDGSYWQEKGDGCLVLKYVDEVVCLFARRQPTISLRIIPAS